MNIKGKVLGDYVIELPVFEDIDYEKGLEIDKELCGQWGCSAIVKVLDNGDTVVARSMDLFYSHKPGYIIRTAVDGFYKTVGISYSSFCGPTFEEVKERGITQEEALAIIFFTADILNEKGLYIEGNMRFQQPECTGIKDSDGTNPDADQSYSLAALIRFLGERAGSVDEAIELANTVNVSGLNNGAVVWGGALFMADATGHYGVLELCDNKLIWNEMENCQTNFYLNEEYKDKAIIGNGNGRYDTLKEGVGAVKTQEDMEDLIAKVKYTQLWEPDTCQFDPRGEFSDINPELFKEYGGYFTMEQAFAEENKEYIMNLLRESGAIEKVKPLSQLRDEGKEWMSIYQSIVNCNKKTLRVIFFEDPEFTFDLKIEQ